MGGETSDVGWHFVHGETDSVHRPIRIAAGRSGRRARPRSAEALTPLARLGQAGLNVGIAPSFVVLSHRYDDMASV